MPKLPRVNSAKVIKALKRARFFVEHITGSHYILYKDEKSFIKTRSLCQFQCQGTIKI